VVVHVLGADDLGEATSELSSARGGGHSMSPRQRGSRDAPLGEVDLVRRTLAHCDRGASGAREPRVAEAADEGSEPQRPRKNSRDAATV
jgi:hypothetical protein